ncbi:delta-60 repeat domain-containing protein [Spirillospora sp. NPDC050679]
MRPCIAVLAAATVTVSAAAVSTSPAIADIRQPRVVSADPVNFTPHVLDGTVRAIAVVGSKAVVAGSFEKVREAGKNKPAVARHNLFAYDLATGKIDPAFRPRVNGTVHTLQAAADASVYLGGTFTTVNGAKTGTLARLKVPTGALVTGFKPAVNYRVYTMARRGAHLYIGGTFTKVAGKARSAVARVNANTGAPDPAFTVAATDPRQGALKVYRLAVNPQNTRLVINGTFTKVDGKRRYQIAMVDTKSSPARLTSWSTERYATPCSTSSFDTYMRGMDFSPDGSYFVVVTTGGVHGPAQLCDTAARWETDKSGSRQNPTWVNWTGGDTLLSTSVTGATVYVGGHQRWMDNKYGLGYAGPGAVARPGIAALNPATGKALPWNPTRTLGHGVEALVATPKGLLVGSDTDRLGGEYHGRLGMFPL